MPRTSASRRAYRRALSQTAQEGVKDAPGTRPAPEGVEPCANCNNPFLIDSDRSDARPGECVFCEDRYYCDRDDDAGDRAYDAAVQRGEA